MPLLGEFPQNGDSGAGSRQFRSPMSWVFLTLTVGTHPHSLNSHTACGVDTCDLKGGPFAFEIITEQKAAPWLHPQ